MYSQQRRKLDGNDSYGGSSANSVYGYDDEYRSTRSRKSAGAASESVVPYDRDAMMRLIAGRMEQLGLNLDQDVKQYKHAPAADLMPYRIRRFVSPFEFYLELAVGPEELSYSTWFPEMQQFYDDPENRDNYNVIHNQPLVGRCYVCRDYQDNMWYRVRVHRIKKDHPISSLIVFYLDTCKLQEVTIRELLELDPTFAEYPAIVFRCYLQDIVPAYGNRLQFQSNACKYLKKYMEDKEFTGLVLNWSNSVIVEDLPDFITDLGIVLVENLPGTRTPRPDACTLNAMMVDNGFAVATGVYASCNHIGDIEGYSPSFDLNEYEQLFPESMDERLSREYQKLQDLRLNEINSSGEVEEPGPSTSFSHDSTATSDLLKESPTAGKVSSETNKKLGMPEAIVKRLAHVRICFVLNPSCMVVHLKCREAELDAMQEAIRQQVEHCEWLTMARPGTLIACNILDVCPEGTRPDRIMWCRGVITAVNKEGLYKILLVDYGNETQSHGHYVRSLPTYFQEIPSFAVRIHLDADGLVPTGQTGWTFQANIDFRYSAFVWEEKGPVYCIYRPGHAKSYELEDYAQQIMYSHEDREWIATPQYRRETKYGVINSLREHPMVHSLFVSCGVELKYEILIPDTSFSYFETISDVLVQKEHGVCNGEDKVNSSILHCDIIDAAESGKVDRHPSLPIAYGGVGRYGVHGSGNYQAGRPSGNLSGITSRNGNQQGQDKVMWKNNLHG